MRNHSTGSEAGPSVLVVIVNYRTPRLVVDCLESLEPEVRDNPGARVVVVDNPSGDDSAEVISAAIADNGWSHWASLQVSPRNGGFAYGNNQAIGPALQSASPPDYFWLVNPDSVVRPGALTALLAFARAKPTAGICGGGIEMPDGEPWRFVFRFPGVLSEFERGFGFGPVTRLLSRWKVPRQMGTEAARCSWVPGCSMMVRRDVFEKIGLMDDGFFLYFEETDYCLRSHRAGFECWYVPASMVMHIAGQSTGVTARTDQPRRLPDYWFDSRRRYFQKNHGRLYACIADLAWLSSHCLGRFRNWLQRRREPRVPHLLRDFVRHSSLWRSIASPREPQVDYTATPPVDDGKASSQK